MRRSKRSEAPTLLQAKRSVAINRTPEDLHAFWRKLENLPRIMEHIAAVTELDGTRSHWVATSIAHGPKLEWDAVITHDVPAKLISWRSEGEAKNLLSTEGSVRFDALRAGRGTLVTFDMTIEPALELVGVFHRLFEKGLQHHMTEDLRRFKQLSETGEIPTTAGQPHGQRSVPMRAFEAVSERMLQEPRGQETPTALEAPMGGQP
jgi:uncharacterized membrane protein